MPSGPCDCFNRSADVLFDGAGLNAATALDVPFPPLADGEFIDTAEALRRLDYCLEWRPWLWRKPARDVLVPFERFRNRRVLELGSRFGRMSCLLAAAGAHVTGVDIPAAATARARDEAKRWGVEARTQFISYDGQPSNLPAGTWDMIFTKSTLVIVRKPILQDILRELKKRLAADGIGLFLENANNKLLEWTRKHVVHRREYMWDRIHWAFYRRNLELIEAAFGPLEVRLHWGLIWSIRTKGIDLAEEP